MKNDFDSLAKLWKEYHNFGNKLYMEMADSNGYTNGDITQEFTRILLCKYYNITLSKENIDSNEYKKVLFFSRVCEVFPSVCAYNFPEFAFELGDFESGRDYCVIVYYTREGNILKAMEVKTETLEKLLYKSSFGFGLNTGKLKEYNDITIDLQNIVDGKQFTRPHLSDYKNIRIVPGDGSVFFQLFDV